MEKLFRPEFWPAWMFYSPLVPYLIYLAVRYKGFGTICSANPGIFLGGLVGESKEEILKNIQSESILSFFKIIRIKPTTDWESLKETFQKSGFKYPYILKPDAGQRGYGVKLIRQEHDASEYLKKSNVNLILQEYHPGPEEAGIFYYRIPGKETGDILSITRKTFPVIEGDGIHTLQDLVLAHPRYKFQWNVFQERHTKDWHRILPKGKRKRLAEAGNHCQGTLFTDGSDLITEDLKREIDSISKTFSGFYFGRYDIRYRSDELLKKGKEFGIVELNGITSESTNLYDPTFSLIRMYSILFKQWNLLFRIGFENQKRGIRKASLIEILKTVLAFYAGDRKIPNRSD